MTGRARLRLRGWLASTLIVLLVATIGATWTLSCARADPCPYGSVQHVGTCINPEALEVPGDQARVEAAVARYGGQIVISHSATRSHLVRFPVHDLDELDRIKAELNAAGLDARYSPVGSLN